MDFYILVGSGLLFSIAGCYWVLTRAHLPRNQFSVLLKLLVTVNLCFAGSQLALFYVLATTSPSCPSSTCTLIRLLQVLVNYTDCLFIFLSLSFCLIPYYIVRLNGSIKNINLNLIIFTSILVSSLSFLLQLPSQIGHLFNTILRLLICMSVLTMAVCCGSTWFSLKQVQLSRQTLLSHVEAQVEQTNYQASLLMMRLSSSLSISNILLFGAQLTYLMHYYMEYQLREDPGYDHYSQNLKTIWMIYQFILASNGGFLTVGFFYAFSKLHQSREPVPHQWHDGVNQLLSKHLDCRDHPLSVHSQANSGNTLPVTSHVGGHCVEATQSCCAFRLDKHDKKTHKIIVVEK
ncbi:hypothetical protein BC833DRAFT_574693 [Globomyces pollinis-pini]|nr:hypothetical protein BC833DRAFT_574693 [Globomyces pollinis-pini]